MQRQEPALFLDEHSAFAPHGEGLHGSMGSTGLITSGMRVQPEKGSPL